MLYSARIRTEFWAEAIMHATWLYNRTYHSELKMTPIQAYTGQIPALDSLVTFGAKITAKQPGTRPTACNPRIYDGIFLGYQNTMHNIGYWDVNPGTIKTAKHEPKDEIQYGDDIENRSLASKHLMEVFTGRSHHTTKTEPETIELDLIDKATPSPRKVLTDILQHSPLPYTATAVAAAKVNLPLPLKKRQRINRLTNKINKMKPAFRRPDILDLKHELGTLDTSTNTYIHTTSHTVPLNNKQFHPTLGIVTQPHPDMIDPI